MGSEPYRQYRPKDRAVQVRSFFGAVRYGFAQADSDTIGARYDAPMDRAAEKAARRGERLAKQLAGKVEAARVAVAAAEADLRCAKGGDKAAARRTVGDRKRDLKRAKNAARKAGVRV